MDKVQTGIITLHRNTNFGANLQAFATNTFLCSHNIPCTVIDYLPSEQDWENHVLGIVSHAYRNAQKKDPLSLLKLTAGLLLFSASRAKKLRNFRRFRKANIRLSRPCGSEREVERLGFNTIICGSDQIWNSAITGGLRDIYYGRIPGIQKRISYAASMGGYLFSEEEQEQVCRLIGELDFCSVREKKTQKYLEELVGCKMECVCDPVFLLEKEDYFRIAGKRLCKENYVLLYGIISDPNMSMAAKAYAEHRNLRLVEVGGDLDRKKRHKQFPGAGPSEFLSALQNADAVFTNSFHGAAFSIIFEKNFFVFNNPHGGSRITDLLDKVGLSERIVDFNSDLSALDETISYPSVKQKLLPYVQFSKDFLLNSVNVEMTPVIERGCFGCGACKAACPVSAIRMIENREGFRYPAINHAICVDCEMCRKICPTLHEPNASDETKDVFAFKASDKTRIKSTSGGAFTAIADYIFSCSGVVYGASLERDWTVRHKRVACGEDLSALQGVKYVQSDTSACFQQIRNDLSDGKYVLFTGTPCQTAAVNRFISSSRVSREKLFLVDIICHGVPSPKVFSDFILWLGERAGSPVESFRFRDKRISWRGASSSASFQNGKQIQENPNVDSFMNCYYSGMITRESCYECRFTSLKRVSDLTISDYWGIEDALPDFEDPLGVSMILVNTEKGRLLLQKIQGAKEKTSLHGVKQPQLYGPSERPNGREAFWEQFQVKGISSVLEKYGGMGSVSIKQHLSGLKRRILNRSN